MRRKLVSALVVAILALSVSAAPAGETQGFAGFQAPWTDLLHAVQHLFDVIASSTSEEGPLIDPNGGAAPAAEPAGGDALDHPAAGGEEGPLIDPNG